DLPGRGAAVLRRGVGLEAQPPRPDPAVHLLRGDHEARGRADAVEDQHQRAATGLASSPPRSGEGEGRERAGWATRLVGRGPALRTGRPGAAADPSAPLPTLSLSGLSPGGGEVFPLLLRRSL